MGWDILLGHAAPREQVEGILQVGVDVVDVPLGGLNVFMPQNPMDGLGAHLVGIDNLIIPSTDDRALMASSWDYFSRRRHPVHLIGSSP